MPEIAETTSLDVIFDTTRALLIKNEALKRQAEALKSMKQKIQVCLSLRGSVLKIVCG